MNATRKDLLQRRARGKAILPQWKSIIERICGITVEDNAFLELEETEELRMEFFDRVRDGDHKRCFVPRIKLEALVLQLQMVAQKIDGYVILFHSKDRFIGALRIKCKVVFEHLEEIWRFTEEDFSVATCDLESGLCLEDNYYDDSGNYVADGIYELTTWGEFALTDIL